MFVCLFLSLFTPPTGLASAGCNINLCTAFYFCFVFELKDTHLQHELVSMHIGDFRRSNMGQCKTQLHCRFKICLGRRHLPRLCRKTKRSPGRNTNRSRIMPPTCISCTGHCVILHSMVRIGFVLKRVPDKPGWPSSTQAICHRTSVIS